MPRWLPRLTFGLGLLALAAVLLLLRFAVVTDYLYHGLVKDPERVPPAGDVIVAPADGTVIYVRPVHDGVVPQVVKRGVAVPLAEHLKLAPATAFPDGWLVGIYMNTDGVHVNRAPVGGVLEAREVWNGPHMDMSEAERTIILTQLLPGWVSLKKLLGLPPYAIESSADFVLKSARETLALQEPGGEVLYVVRIADYTVGKILTWIQVGQEVALGQRIGMITFGSQTDVFFPRSAATAVRVRVGDHVYAGETILAAR
jgi:phosphatidylserine decarboxylase